MNRGIAKYLPGAGTAGFPLSVSLSDHGQGITEATAGIDEYIVPRQLIAGKRGVPAILTGVQFSMVDLGTGTESGFWTLQILKGTTVIASGTIAYNATTKRTQVSTVGSGDKGVTLAAGDVLSLKVSGVPTGTISAGAKGIRAQLLLQVFGVAVGG